MFELEQASEPDFPALVSLLWFSYGNPPTSHLPLMFDLSASPPSSPSLSTLQTSIEVFRQLHRTDSTSRWLKVTDTSTGTIVGGARYHLHESNPYPENPLPYVALKQPVGVKRGFSSYALGRMLDPRTKRYTRPHVQLRFHFVHPSYRRRGIGTMLLRWGIQRADEMGLDLFLEATEVGRTLYVKSEFGLRLMCREEVDTSGIQAKSEEWLSLEQMWLPFFWYCMWRPKGGRFVEGETEMPW